LACTHLQDRRSIGATTRRVHRPAGSRTSCILTHTSYSQLHITRPVLSRTFVSRIVITQVPELVRFRISPAGLYPDDQHILPRGLFSISSPTLASDFTGQSSTMGFFSRKKKTTSPGTPSPATSSSPRLPAALPPPEVVEPVEPPMTLSVVLDGWTIGRQVQCFTIQIAKDADTTILRQNLSNHIGNVSMSLFKVGHSYSYKV
jgi:hypothetical protein